MVYTKEDKDRIFDDVCKAMELGTSLREILKGEGMPSTRTFYNWMKKDEERVKQYAHASDMRADAIFDEMFEIADDSTNDYMKKLQGDQMVDVVNAENIQRSKLRIDTRKWALSKLNPKKYSEKQGIDLSTDLNKNHFLDLMQSSTSEE